MKRLLLLFLKERESVCVCAQNLVLNGSFEDTIACPYDAGDIDSAQFWFEPYPCSADYFHECNNNTTGTVGVPCHAFEGGGCRNANTGVAYSGFIVYNQTGELREYIETKLISPLLAGKNYCLQLYVSLLPTSKYATDAIHALFTNDSLKSSDCLPPLLEPQIKNPNGNFIIDTANWSLIEGEFLANGGEQFLTIGNFNNNNNTQIIVANSGVFDFGAYYYIDDVSVTLCDTTAVEEFKIEDYKLKIYPNPASSNFTITAKGGDEIIITDIAGRKIREYNISQNTFTLLSDDFINGIYFLSLHNNNRLIGPEKLVILNE